MKQNKYKFNYLNNYITGFQAVLDDNYDFQGQMAEYPDVLNSFPEGWYKFENGEFVLDQTRKDEVIAEREAEAEKPTWEETIEAQTYYTAMMTDTLLEE